MEVETTRPLLPASAPFMPEFAADNLTVADQLVQLSLSRGDGGDEEDQCCSSLARSVNNAEDEDDEDATGRGLLDRRARKRYQLVSELYAATRQVKAAGAGGGGGRRWKGRDGTEN
ncbi:unnamed protein product [Miscanthus lutarioriparius]|uniref:Uncharacterized protein n=1 Tax=Miscanthus lutarioriparius TaxID=422564 RepID=A0A811R355_9POAL|nr:unnamed protein product [Miscanthus lutarioriparius]